MFITFARFSVSTVVCASTLHGAFLAAAVVSLFFVIYHLLMKQGVALTGRNTTGPPRASPGELRCICECYRRRQTTDDDDRRQRPLLVQSPTLCVGGPERCSMIRYNAGCNGNVKQISAKSGHYFRFHCWLSVSVSVPVSRDNTARYCC